MYYHLLLHTANERYHVAIPARGDQWITSVVLFILEKFVLFPLLIVSLLVKNCIKTKNNSRSEIGCFGVYWLIKLK